MQIKRLGGGLLGVRVDRVDVKRRIEVIMQKRLGVWVRSGKVVVWRGVRVNVNEELKLL